MSVDGAIGAIVLVSNVGLGYLCIKTGILSITRIRSVKELHESIVQSLAHNESSPL